MGKAKPVGTGNGQEEAALAFKTAFCLAVLPTLHRQAAESYPDAELDPLFVPVSALAIELLEAPALPSLLNPIERDPALKEADRLKAILKEQREWLATVERRRMYEDRERLMGEVEDRNQFLVEEELFYQGWKPHSSLTLCCDRIAANLSHPNLVGYIDLGRDCGLLLAAAVRETTQKPGWDLPALTYKVGGSVHLIDAQHRGTVTRILEGLRKGLIATRNRVDDAWAIYDLIGGAIACPSCWSPPPIAAVDGLLTLRQFAMQKGYKGHDATKYIDRLEKHIQRRDGKLTPKVPGTKAAKGKRGVPAHYDPAYLEAHHNRMTRGESREL